MAHWWYHVNVEWSNTYNFTTSQHIRPERATHAIEYDRLQLIPEDGNKINLAALWFSLFLLLFYYHIQFR